MKFGGLSWELVGGIVLVVCLALGTSFWLFTAEVERLRDDELTEQLLAEARMLGFALHDTWEARDARPIAGMVHALHNEGTDVVVMVADGTVLVNTTSGSQVTDDLLRQPATKSALLSGSSVDTVSGIHGPAPSRMVTVRMGSDQDELGVVWLARPRWTFASHARHLGPVLALIGASAVAAILGLALALTHRWTGLLRRLTRAAHSFSAGDLSVRAEVSGSDEFALLAGALNETRRRLLAHAETNDRQRRTLEALLAALHEGVIVTDGDARIVLINPAAIRLLNLGLTETGGSGLVGRAVEECVPQHELQRLLRVAAAPTDGESGTAVPSPPEERPLRVASGSETVHLLARGADLRLPVPGQQRGGTVLGRLVVLTDVTALRQALQMQTDFVANASHELRTPLASIRAAVETLLSLDLAKDHVAAGQFVEIIDRHSARLTSLATDLLDLSRVQAAAAPAQAVTVVLADVSRELSERFADAVRTKGLHWQADWETTGPRTLVVNTDLLRLVLDNLVDNAIQFTAAGGHISVMCRVAAENVVFEVGDDGCGIPESDQARVFERFYQVERARSGARRGSGLGLAIVRDAVAALGGTVQLQSQVGRGTRVMVTIPQSR